MKTLDGKKAVVFDLDGTLIYTPEGVLIGRVSEVLKIAKLPRQSSENILRFFREHNWDSTLRSWGLAKEKIVRFWNFYIEYVENRENDGTSVYADVFPCFEKLKFRKFGIGVVSYCTPKYLRRQIEKIGNSLTGNNFVDAYTCVGEHSEQKLKGKPNADGILYILSEMGVSSRNVVSVGNSDLDTESARNAGCLDVLIDRGENAHSIKPSFLIKSLDELE